MPESPHAPDPPSPSPDPQSPSPAPPTGPDRNATPDCPDRDLGVLRERLLDFFDARGRALPWRETDDPYAIWVSEIMLQQTRVETAVPYWTAWMAAFPTVEALAAAEDQTVLKSWEGLGYYSRARNLHRAARVVRERWNGRVPGTRDDLRTLPGVGPYTAGAVASIAFGETVPAVDGNVRRVAARLLDWPDPRGAALETEVGRWVPEGRPGDFNQALMELGATVCTPRRPRCDDCPVAGLCRARAEGTVGDRPVPRKRAAVPRVHHAVVVAIREVSGEFRVALRRRPEGGLLAGLWEFPAVEVEEPEGVAEALVGVTGGAGAPGERLPSVPHAFSHLHVTYHPMLIRLAPGRPAPGGAEWRPLEGMADLPLPTAQQTIAGHLTSALAG